MEPVIIGIQNGLIVGLLVMIVAMVPSLLLVRQFRTY